MTAPAAPYSGPPAARRRPHAIAQDTGTGAARMFEAFAGLADTVILEGTPAAYTAQ